LSSINKQKPGQIIVVINGPKNNSLEWLCKKYTNIECYWTKKPGKRNAIRLGMTKAKNEIIVIVDSDTIWQPKALSELLKPFIDPKIGGVTTKQQITNPDATLISRLCEWMEDIRSNGSMKAMSVAGTVGCLPGRTIAFRRSILKQIMPDFMNEKFLGFHKEVSDDRSLTNLTLKAGYKTVLQSTSLVLTEAPKTWKKFIRQQLRWSEGSQYNNIKMTPWMIRHAKLTLFIYWIDTIIPFMLWGIYLSWILYLMIPNISASNLNYDVFNTNNTYALTALVLAGAYISYAFRHLRTIFDDWSQIVYLPFYIFALSFVLAPIRIIGFARLADDMSWGTRNNAYKGIHDE
jgi:hyaluronan synthase